FIAKRTIQEKSRSPEVDAVEQLEKKWKEEKEAYRNELTKRQKAEPYHEHEADKAEAAGLWDTALWHLNKLLGEDASPDRKARRRARRARLHACLGQWQKAAADYKEAINAVARPEVRSHLVGDLLPRLHVRLAQAYARDEKALAEALREYEAAARLN